jgi:hypothetical protein
MKPQMVAGDPGTERDDFGRRLADLESARDLTGATTHFLVLRNDFDAMAHPLRRSLLSSPLEWSEAEKTDARWLHRACDRLAALGCRISSALAGQLASGRDAREALAVTLLLMGETVKWDISAAPDAPHDLRKVHTLMHAAMREGQHREPQRLRLDGRDAPCTIESLYFRVLLLARFASGALNNKQIEILDAWMWLWMPVLSGSSSPPPGAALRADLDSSGGLQRGPRKDEGPSLYLPHGPIEEAYRTLLREFHAGQIMPAEGVASDFRIEEHIAVLDLIRQGLDQARRTPVARSTRLVVDRGVEILIGLGEIMARGFLPPAPEAGPITLASLNAGTRDIRRLHERDSGIEEIYDAERRIARLADESETGLGLEGSLGHLGSIAAGDLVAVRLSPTQPLVICKVARSVLARARGQVFLGLQRLTNAAQLVTVRVERSARASQSEQLLFVPGDDSCGRHDAWLVSDRAFGERTKLVVAADGKDFSLRLNRARMRGRGWVLAGFEVSTARPHDQFEIA